MKMQCTDCSSVCQAARWLLLLHQPPVTGEGQAVLVLACTYGISMVYTMVEVMGHMHVI